MNKKITKVIGIAAVLMLLCVAVVGSASAEVPTEAQLKIYSDALSYSTDEGITWTPVPQDGTDKTYVLPISETSITTYTLAENVDLSTLSGNFKKDIKINGTATLDLNGHVLRGTGTSSVITIEPTGNLTLTSEDTETPHKFTVDEETGLWGWVGETETGGTKTVTGGCVTGGIGTKANTWNEVFGGGVYVKGNNQSESTGSFAMTGGNIVGNTANDGGGGIYCYLKNSSGGMNISNSTISGNTAVYNGAGIYCSLRNSPGDVVISESNISENTVTWSAGGIDFYVHNNTDNVNITISESTISNNTAGDYGGGIEIYTGAAGDYNVNFTISDSTMNFPILCAIES